MDLEEVRVDYRDGLRRDHMASFGGIPAFGLSRCGSDQIGTPPTATIYWKGTFDRAIYFDLLDKFSVTLQGAPALSGTLRGYGISDDWQFDVNQGSALRHAKKLADGFDILRADFTTGLGEFTLWAAFDDENVASGTDLTSDGENIAVRVGEALFPLMEERIAEALEVTLPDLPRQYRNALNAVWSSTSSEE